MEKSGFTQSVLITGANRGMGLAYVEFYLKKGRQVIATTKNPLESFELISFQNEYPKQLIILELNLESEKSIIKLKDGLIKSNVTISIAINNAGIAIEEALGEWSMSNFERHFRINTIGPALVSQALLPFMEDGGKLVQISSGMGSIQWNINPINDFDAYAASKCALHSITVRLAEKLKDQQITVVAINPGWVKTDMGGSEAPTLTKAAVRNITRTIDGLSYNHSGQFLSDLGEQIPW